MASDDTLTGWQDRLARVTGRLELVARDLREEASRLQAQHPLDLTAYGPALSASLAASNAVGQAVTLKAGWLMLTMKRMNDRTLAMITGGEAEEIDAPPPDADQAVVVRLEQLADRLEAAATLEARIAILLEPA